MRLILLSLVIAVALALPVSAQNAQIEGTIAGQIEALKADDFPGAFTFASPGIQGLFGSPERFGTMVKRGYPMVHRPAEVRYLDLREVGGGLWQRVQITDQAGRVHLLDYEMIQSQDGWKINAVQLLQMPGAAV